MHRTVSAVSADNVNVALVYRLSLPLVEQEQIDAGDQLRNRRDGGGGGGGTLLHEVRQGPRAQERRHVGEGEDDAT